MTEQRLQEIEQALVVEPPYDPSCVECRRAAGKDLAGTTWQCVGHVYRERDLLRSEIRRLRAEVEQAQQELLQRNGELVEAVSDREKWEEEAQRWQRETGYWAARGREREAAAQPPALPPLPETRCNCWLGDPHATFGSSEVRVNCPVHGDSGLSEQFVEGHVHAYGTLPGVLPPLPGTWVEAPVWNAASGREVHFSSPNYRFRVCVDATEVECYGGPVVVDGDNVADLLIVLRHAEAAHMELKEGK